MARSTQGFEKLERRLARIPKKVKDEVEKALVKSAEETAAAQRALAESSRDTGDLIASIAVTPPGGTTPAYSQPGGSTRVPEGAAAVTAGNTGVRYAHLVEFGTRRAPAQPFFFPGYRMTKTRNARRIKRALGQAVRNSKNG